MTTPPQFVPSRLSRHFYSEFLARQKPRILRLYTFGISYLGLLLCRDATLRFGTTSTFRRIILSKWRSWNTREGLALHFSYWLMGSSRQGRCPSDPRYPRTRTRDWPPFRRTLPIAICCL